MVRDHALHIDGWEIMGPSYRFRLHQMPRTSEPCNKCGGSQSNNQFQPHNQQQLASAGRISCVRCRPAAVGVAGTSRSEQQDGMECHHHQGSGGYLVKRPHTAVAPDVNCAGQADRRHDDHEKPQPYAVVPGHRQPQMSRAGDRGRCCTERGMEDRPGEPDPSRRDGHR